MKPEAKAMIKELLNNDDFQKWLNEASLNIKLPSNFNILKQFIPEGKPHTIEYVQASIKEYRAHVIIETRKFLTEAIETTNGETTDK